MTTVVTRSEDETIAAGRGLARHVGPGDVILLEGTLGAGKTAFVRGLADGLGCNPDDVSSPTFTIVQEYRPSTAGRGVVLEHVDLYRLSPAEVDDLALEDLMEGRVLAVEWPDRWHRAPSDAVVVRITVTGGDIREIRIHKRSP